MACNCEKGDEIAAETLSKVFRQGKVRPKRNLGKTINKMSVLSIHNYQEFKKERFGSIQSDGPGKFLDKESSSESECDYEK